MSRASWASGIREVIWRRAFKGRERSWGRVELGVPALVGVGVVRDAVDVGIQVAGVSVGSGVFSEELVCLVPVLGVAAAKGAALSSSFGGMDVEFGGGASVVAAAVFRESGSSSGFGSGAGV